MSLGGQTPERVVAAVLCILLVAAPIGALVTSTPGGSNLEEERRQPKYTSANEPTQHAVIDWGGLGSTTACQVHDPEDAWDGSTGSSATFQMSETNGTGPPTCHMGIDLQYNYQTAAGGALLKPTNFTIEVEYSQSLATDNCAWVYIIAYDGHVSPGQGTVFGGIGGSSSPQYWVGDPVYCGNMYPGNSGPLPLPSSPLSIPIPTTSFQSYNESNSTGFTVEIRVNPHYEPQFNLYIDEVVINASDECYQDVDCDGISDDDDSIDYEIDWHPSAEVWGGNLDPAMKTPGPPGIGIIAPPCVDSPSSCDTNTAVSATLEHPAAEMRLQFGLGKGSSYEESPSDIISYFYVENQTGGGWDTVYSQTGLRTGGTWETITLWPDHYNESNTVNISFRVHNQQTGQVGSVTGSWSALMFYEAMDVDSDGDGTLDGDDAFPMNPDEWLDTDGDGTGDNADEDDDGDGWSDADEEACGTEADQNTSVPQDYDSDGLCDLLDTEDEESSNGSGGVSSIGKMAEHVVNWAIKLGWREMLVFGIISLLALTIIRTTSKSRGDPLIRPRSQQQELDDDVWDSPKAIETAKEAALPKPAGDSAPGREDFINRESWEKFGRKVDELSISEEYRRDLRMEIGQVVEWIDVDGVLNHSRNAAMRVLCGYIVEAEAYLRECVERTEGITPEIRQGFLAKETFMKKVRKADGTVDGLGGDLSTTLVKDYNDPNNKKEIPLMRVFGWEDAKNPFRKMQPLVSESSMWMKKTKKRNVARIKRHLAALLDSLDDFVQAAEDAIKNRNPE